MKADNISKAFHSRWALFAALIIMVLSAVYALDAGEVSQTSGRQDGILRTPIDIVLTGNVSMWVNFTTLAIIVGMMIFINKIYNIPRTITLIYATMFAVMMTATPDITARFCDSTVLCAVVMVCMILMFGVYGRLDCQENIFTVFLLLSASTMLQYAMVLYIPVFFIACAQMRVMSFRTIMAALLGVVTPWWILFGFGIISPDDICFPGFVSVFAAADRLDAFIMIVTASLTVILAVTAYLLSLLKLMTYNARMRACNGLLLLITFVTIPAMCFDFTNFVTYMTLLNCCTAFLTGHLFLIRSNPRSWIAITSIILSYYVLYIWKIFV